MRIPRILYLCVGFISLGLGLLGILLPILPTTPFLLLTSYCFARGSERFYDWFTNTSIYKKHLESFVESRSMPLKTKIMILVFASTLLLFPLLLVDVLPMRIFIICLYIFKYYYFIFRIKTI